MARGILIMVLATLLAGCGPSQRERQAAWLREFQVEQDAVYRNWETEVAERRFSTNAKAVEDLKARYERLYSRWTLQMDLLGQALLSYAFALASRVDRGAIPRQEAIRLCDNLKNEIDTGRGTLASALTEEQREAAEREWWERFWTGQSRTYQATPSDPISCAVIPRKDEGSSVICK